MHPNLRIATYNIDFWAKGPGLALQSLQRGDNPAQLAAVQVIAKLDADVLLLTGIDYDLHGETLAALEKLLAAAGAPYPYRLALRPNTGVATGLDLNGNGVLGEPRDAQGYGRWAGEGGMAATPGIDPGTTDHPGRIRQGATGDARRRPGATRV